MTWRELAIIGDDVTTHLYKVPNAFAIDGSVSTINHDYIPHKKDAEKPGLTITGILER